jgi:AbrB family looped-hinge helix DNA binding protein
VSTKGQVVIPLAIREKLQLRPGDLLETRSAGNHIVLTPTKKRLRYAHFRKDPLTGFPVLTAGPRPPQLTSKQVAEILAEFP